LPPEGVIIRTLRHLNYQFDCSHLKLQTYHLRYSTL